MGSKKSAKRAAEKARQEAERQRKELERQANMRKQNALDLAMKDETLSMSSGEDSAMQNDGMGGTLLTGNEGVMITQDQKKKKTMLSGAE